MRYLPRRPWDLPARLLTDEPAFERRRADRRSFLRQGAGLAGSALAGTALMGTALSGTALLAPGCRRASLPMGEHVGKRPLDQVPLAEPAVDLLRPGYPAKANPRYALDRPQTDERVAAMYNNFYEFTEDKTEVKDLVGDFQPRPWSIEITGAVERPQVLELDALERLGLEERAYRFRCVEAWAMAVPWTGIPLATVLARARPLSKARFVRFFSFDRPTEARGQRLGRRYRWPYYEGLRMREAMHPLTLLATGIYGHALPRQHGAPVRLVVPWKYGFKSIKSVTRIEVTEVLPNTFWNDLQPKEYRFSANVNPQVPHPRWSQARERMIGTWDTRPSRWLNGYADEVAQLYGRQPIESGWQDAPSPFRDG